MKLPVAVLSGLMLAGCAQYQAKPLQLAQYPAQFAIRRIDPRPSSWSVAELLDVALANNPDVAQARARYRTALAAAKAARQVPPASLALTAEYSKDADGSSPWLYGIGSDFPLNFGARRDVRLTTADLTALQALYDYGEALWAVRTALARAVVETASADHEVPLAAQAAALRRDRFNRMSQRAAAGEDARPFALLAQGELLTAERRVAEAAARQEQGRAALAKALGVPLEAIRDIKLAQPPSPAFVPADLSIWRQEAALSRRDVLRAVADYDLAEAALRLEVARQYPQISVGPGYTWERGVNKLPFNLGLTLPPYDLNRAAINQAEARRADAGASLEAVQAGVLAGVDQAASILRSTQQIAAQIETRDLSLARRAGDAARHSADAGETDRVDQLAAEAAAHETALALADAHRAAALAAVELEDALRRPFDIAQTEILKSKAAAGDPI